MIILTLEQYALCSKKCLYEAWEQYDGVGKGLDIVNVQKNSTLLTVHSVLYFEFFSTHNGKFSNLYITKCILGFYVQCGNVCFSAPL